MGGGGWGDGGRGSGNKLHGKILNKYKNRLQNNPFTVHFRYFGFLKAGIVTLSTLPVDPPRVCLIFPGFTGHLSALNAQVRIVFC